MSLPQQLDGMRRQVFGAKSERFINPAPDCPTLPGLEIPTVTAEKEKQQIEYERHQHRNQTGWGKLPDNLQCKEQIIPLPEAQRFTTDGRALKFIGYEEIERLAWRGGHYVKVIKRETTAGLGDLMQNVIDIPCKIDYLVMAVHSTKR